MFRLQRPDVLPVGDLGICTAVQRIYQLRQRPTPERLIKIGEAWRPYRSIACWYLWESLKVRESGLGARGSNGTKPSSTKARSPRRSRSTSRVR
jgi:DNA-3-methyladenine glycosylase II